MVPEGMAGVTARGAGRFGMTTLQGAVSPGGAIEAQAAPATRGLWSSAQMPACGGGAAGAAVVLLPHMQKPSLPHGTRGHCSLSSD